MRLVVEEMTTHLIRGWAFVDVESLERVQVVGRIGDNSLFSVTSNIFRKDLKDNNIGDGCYGFLFTWPDTMWDFIRNNLDLVEIVAKSPGSTDEVHADFAFCIPEKQCQAGDKMYKKKFIGDSFLLENLSSTGVNPISFCLSMEEQSDLRVYLFLKTCSFGDYLWWDESDPTVMSARRLFEKLGTSERGLLRDGRMLLVFDMSSEGPPADYYSDWHVLLHEELKRQEIRASSCIMINQNRFYEYDYRTWCRKSGYSDRMHILCYDYYIARLANILDQKALGKQSCSPVDPAKWRHFICLNFTPRPVRVAFVSWLFGKGYDNKGLISFAGFRNFKADGRQYEVPNWFPDRIIAIEGMSRLREVGAVQLDLGEHVGSNVPEFDLGPADDVARSFFTIVTESDFSPGDILRVTEKSLKPFAYGHPCLIVGNPGSLRIMRELGFKTFSPYIDESYDQIDDRALRMSAIQREVDRLCAMDFEQLKTFRSKLKDITAYNFQHARRGLAATYRERFHVELIRQIARTKSLGLNADLSPQAAQF